MLRRRIGIRAHPMEGHVGNGKRSGLVEVHVFNKSICIEEVITLPSRRKGRQRSGAELRVYVVSRSEDNKAIVTVLQKHGDIAVTCVASALASEGASGAGAIVVIGEIAGSFTVHLLGITAECQRRSGERQLSQVDTARLNRSVVYQYLIPVNL